MRFFTRLKLHKTDQKRIGRTFPRVCEPSDSTKRKLEGKRGVFSYAKRVSGYDQETTPEEVQRKTPDVTDALVNEHQSLELA